MTALDLLRKEFFNFDVTITNGIARWENHKHPDNPKFSQPVFWRCWESNGNLMVSYQLDTTSANKKHLKAIPLNGQTFEEALFQYWNNQ